MIQIIPIIVSLIFKVKKLVENYAIMSFPNELVWLSSATEFKKRTGLIISLEVYSQNY